MRKFLLLLIIFAFSFVSAFGQGVLQQTLKRAEAHHKTLKTLQADITITKFTAQFGGSYTKEGVMKFVPQGNDYWLKIDSTNPAAESFLIIKNEYLLYLPNLKIAYTGTTTDSQKNILEILFVLASANYKSDYSIRYIGQEKLNATISTWHLELTPKTAKSYAAIELWINANGMAIQSRIIEDNGDWTTVFLGNPQKNVTVKGSDFKITLPKDVKLIKN